MTRHRCSSWPGRLGALPVGVLLLGAACGSGAKPIPKAPPSPIGVIADDERGSQGGPGQAAPQGEQAQGDGPPLRRDRCGIAKAVSMEGLMAPGGIARVQRELVGRGLLAASYRDGELDRPTIEAIIELQRRSDLPTVGLPSYASVRALGIEPADVFASGSTVCRGAS